jgi:hypothetical protein
LQIAAGELVAIDLTVPVLPLRSGSYDVRVSFFESEGNSLVFSSSRECDIEVQSSFFSEDSTLLPLSCHPSLLVASELA